MVTWLAMEMRVSFHHQAARIIGKLKTAIATQL